jgi:hypothetical protein
VGRGRLLRPSRRRRWELLTAPVDYAERLPSLDCPLPFVKHEGCLMSTEEGWEDAVAAVPDAPPVSHEFAEVLRRFCLAHER